MSRIRTRIFDGTTLRGRGGGVIVPPSDGRLTYAQRESLEFGDYVPNETNTGLLPGSTIGNLPTRVTSNVTLNPGQLYVDTAFWGQVSMPRGPSGEGPRLRNCFVGGIDPDTIGSATKRDARDGVNKTYLYAADSTPIRAADSDTLPWLMEDSVVKPGAWFDPAANPPGGARSGNKALKLRSCLGIRGGNGTLKRVDISESQDGISVVQAMASSSDPSRFDVLGCWVHDMLHYEGADHWQYPEGTHDDAIQFHFIKNMLVKGSRISVPRNAGFMIQLEVGTQWLENIIIEENFIEGVSGTSGWGVNHALSSPTPFSGSAVRNNRFVQRADGKYMIVHNQYPSFYSGNRVVQWVVPGVSWTDVGAAPVSNGGG